MKPGILTNKRLWLPVLAIGVIVLLGSWDYQQTPSGNGQQQTPTDTLPKKKKTVTEKKIRDLDDVLDELNAVDMETEMKKAQEEMSKALKQIDEQKIKLDFEKAMREVDFSKMKAELDKAMKELDVEKIKMEVEQSIAKIDWEKMKKEFEEVKKIDYSKMEQEMKVQMKEIDEEMKKLKPQLEKEMANLKVELENAKVEIEKAKAEMKEVKEFVDGLDKDGLISKKDPYTIKHEAGVLTVNGKKVSEQVYSKYRSFLTKHPKFNIEKTADDFDIDMD